VAKDASPITGEVGLGDTVADHRHAFASRFEILDLLRLVRGQDLGKHGVDPELLRNGIGNRFRIAGAHHDLDSSGMQTRDGLVRSSSSTPRSS
jgi:hypothetical protein